MVAIKKKKIRLCADLTVPLTTLWVGNAYKLRKKASCRLLKKSRGEAAGLKDKNKGQRMKN